MASLARSGTRSDAYSSSGPASRRKAFADDLVRPRKGIGGEPLAALGLDKLIEVKRAAGRPKDLEALAELVAIRERRS